MDQIDEKYWNLISKSLSNNLSLEEEIELKKWQESDPSHQQLLQELEESWNFSGQYGSHFSPNKEQAWRKVAKQLDLETSVHKTPIRSLITWTRAAAAIILAILGSWLVWYFANQPDWITIASANTVKEVVLPDGSKVWLSPNSSIRYLENMTKEKQREIVMEGEAYFDVTHNPAQPFVVQALETETKVLGTSFNVLAHKSTPVVQVSVVTGKVRFSQSNAEKKQLILEPGTQGIYTKSTAALTKKQTANKNFLFWKNKQLDFSNVTVQEALKDLEKNYGVHFLIQDASIGSKRITTSFRNETIEQIIAELKLLLDVEITRSDSTYHIRPIK